MTSFRFRGHPSRNTAILFLGVAAISVAVLVWMGVRLVQQDRVLEAAQLQERREAPADRLTASLEQVLSAEESRLAGLPSVGFRPSADDVVMILAGSPGSSEFQAWPDHALFYYPVISAGREPPSSLFSEAERSEFIDNDYRRSVGALLPFSKAAD